MDTASSGIQSDHTLLDIVEAMFMLGGGTLDEIAREADVSKSTVHRHVNTLRDRGYVKPQNGEYVLSFKFLEIAGELRAGYPFSQRIRKTVREVAELTGEFVGYVTEELGTGVFLFAERGQRGVPEDILQGARINLTTAASGKAILSCLSREKIESIIDEHGLPQETNNSVTDPAALFSELEQIRERGYAYSRGEYIEGVWAVAAPIDYPEGMIGSIAVSGPKHRMEGARFETDIPNLLTSTIGEFELNVEHM